MAGGGRRACPLTELYSDPLTASPSHLALKGPLNTQLTARCSALCQTSDCVAPGEGNGQGAGAGLRDLAGEAEGPVVED